MAAGGNKQTLPEVPMHLDSGTRRLLVAMRNQIHILNAGMVPPQQVSNLSAVPIAGGNKVRFTRGDSDYYVLYWSNTPNRIESQSVDLGISNEYDDNVGTGGVQRWYWIRSKKTGTADSVPMGPVTATSLAPGTATTVPPAPPTSKIIATDQSTGDQVAIRYGGGNPAKEL